jgi:hypothetical protein
VKRVQELGSRAFAWPSPKLREIAINPLLKRLKQWSSAEKAQNVSPHDLERPLEEV